MHRILATLCLSLALAAAVAAPAAAQIEDYADYKPQTHCSPKAKPGTTLLSRWVVRKFGGSRGMISRRCKVGGTSEHKEGRAFDWSLDASRKKDRLAAKAFLEHVFAVDNHDHEHAKARRMGIMYVIWNDHMYSAWDRFEKDGYLSSSCKKVTKCSKTLRHRDHVHVSLSRAGGKGLTSFYEGKLD